MWPCVLCSQLWERFSQVQGFDRLFYFLPDCYCIREALKYLFIGGDGELLKALDCFFALRQSLQMSSWCLTVKLIKKWQCYIPKGVCDCFRTQKVLHFDLSKHWFEYTLHNYEGGLWILTPDSCGNSVIQQWNLDIKDIKQYEEKARKWCWGRLGMILMNGRVGSRDWIAFSSSYMFLKANLLIQCPLACSSYFHTRNFSANGITSESKCPSAQTEPWYGKFFPDNCSGRRLLFLICSSAPKDWSFQRINEHCRELNCSKASV